jgi:hypothetical protein
MVRRQVKRQLKVRYVFQVSLMMVMLQCLSAVAWGQSITGVVKDSSGAAIPGATVTASSPALIEGSSATKSDAQGLYRLVNLRPGTYAVTVAAPGFTTAKRDGIALAADFTATIDMLLVVGEVSQTVEVTAATPLVDVTNVNAETNISQKLLDDEPVSRNVLGFSALTVGAIIPQTAQDVGGSKGEISIRVAFHGSHAIEETLLLDGMLYNTLLSVGNRTFFPNPATTEEFTLSDGSGGQAEFLGAGAAVNAVPRDGSNDFHGSFYSSYTGGNLQGTNLTPALQARGLIVSSKLDQIYDFDLGLGGAIVKNHLWYFAGFRNWGDSELSPSLQYNADPNSYVYMPNGVPALQHDYFRNENGRLTWQATTKHKFSFSTDQENNCTCNSQTASLFTSNLSPEASRAAHYYPNRIYQMTWIGTLSPKFVLDAGAEIYQATFTDVTPSSAATDGISVVDNGIGITYRAPAPIHTIGIDPVQFYRASASYVTGTHNFKLGMQLEHGYLDETVLYNNAAISFTFNNGVPSTLTEYASPVHTKQIIIAPGFYAQDQWTLFKRLTLSYGARFDLLRNYIPANTEPPGTLVGARSFPQVPCVPCWNDFTPRIGASYDLRGNGKTAIKFGIGRYVTQQAVSLAQAADPANVNASTTRSWADSNHNFVPDCNLENPAANGECGKVSNTAFGQDVPSTTYDPALLNGWQHRPYNWQLSTGFQQQVSSNLAISIMYFRTTYGNFTVTDNLDVTPANYDPYCVAAPTNAKLPHGGGYQICGLYDLNPSKLGQVNNLVTFASKFGKETEQYQGADVAFQLRIHHADIGGGMNVGNSNGTTSSQSDCFVVNSPEQLYQCNQPFPYQYQWKFHGTYDFPWKIQLGATFQSLPGIPITSTWAAPNALIAPSLGRNLSSGSTASVQLIQPNTLFEGRINQTDIRLTKSIRLWDKFTLQGIMDLANIFNSSAIESDNLTYGTKWLTPTQILDPRLVKFGGRIEW